MQASGLTYAAIVVLAIIAGVATSGIPFRDRDPKIQFAARAESPAESAAPVRTTTTAASTTPTTTPPLRVPSDVRVLVANGTNVTGAAAHKSGRLEDLGYVTTPSVDADSLTETTKVFYGTGDAREANAIAAVVGAPTSAVTAMPAALPVDDLQGAVVLVVLGRDLAAQ